ncbi:MAG TPA: hypothetical protein GX404_00865, partial [Syntrophomonadaceae bacterium]|nr:hypothetical protein [Syntrophomonadaceae bacterium]
SYQRAEEICQLPELSFTQKLTRMLEYIFIDSYAGQELEQRIQKEYAAFSDQIWQENIRQLTPIVKALVKQAVDEGLTDSECSDDTAAFIICRFGLFCRCFRPGWSHCR